MSNKKKDYYKDYEGGRLIFLGGISDNLWLEDGKFLSRNYKQGYRVYDADGISNAITSNGGGFGGCGGGVYLVKESLPTKCFNTYKKLNINITKENYRMEKLRVFEAFKGYGSQTIALDNIGVPYEVVATSEIDPDAIIAYGAIRHNLSQPIDKTIDEIKEYLMERNIGFDFKKGKSSIPRMKKDKLRLLYNATILSHELGDVSKIKPEDIPDHDLFTYSFPCQDISVAGKQAGLEKGGNTRSGLLWECEKIIAAKKPRYLLMENVKNLVGKQFKPDFDKWCEWLETQGYKNFYKVLNAKNHRIPQNRERVFMISILDNDATYEFPLSYPLEMRLKDILEDTVEEKYYIDTDASNRLIKSLNEKGFKTNTTGISNNPVPRECNDFQECRTTLLARDYKDPKIVLEQEASPSQRVLPCITPGRINKQQNGRRFKEDGEPMFTLTNQDVHGVLLVDKTVFEQRADEGARLFKDELCGALRTIDSCGDKRVVECAAKLEVTDPTILRAERTEYGKTIRKGYEKGEIDEKIGNMRAYKPRPDDLTNTITTVQKDNMLLEPTKSVECGAIRGRYAPNGCIEQQLELNGQESANTITTVQKDNVLLEKVDELKPKRIGGLFDDEKGTHQAGSIWDDGHVSTVGDTCQGGYRQPCIIDSSLAKTDELVPCCNLEGGGVEPKVMVTEATKQGYAIAEVGDSINIEHPNSKTRRGRVDDQHAQTLTTSCNQATLEPNYRIRKLTPRECWRLMAVPDELFNRVQEVGISNSQLYKLAGNSIVVTVLEDIFRQLFKGCIEENF